jgi:hypothetical protein
VETAHEFYTKHGKKPLIAMRGEKFFKAFVRFMATINHFKEQDKKAREACELQICNTKPSDDSTSNTEKGPIEKEGQLGGATALVGTN